ncbi:IclR family transcriptional regulator [Aminobacter sp. MSH1]|uniref:IclR family transcriptional regulator n=1 Tax=Aminobacter sp. MSH1 TaxID=374606 RepID=UPI001FE202D1|nr:IclR family transcriptional regulator [Aminobacter sp. MSH1]
MVLRKSQDARNGIQVIARAAAVLRILKGSTGMSLGQIAERVGLPRSTVQRIVGALQTERLVVASSGGAGIRLGPELHALSEAARFSVVDVLRPLLQRLSSQTEETVDLSMLRDGKMVFIDQVPGSHRLRAVSAVGERFPLATTANGRACLALMDESEARSLIASEGSPALSKKVMAKIAQIRQQGLAFDEDEHTPGISAVGLGFVDLKGDRYAVSVPVPTSRFTQQREKVSAALRLLRQPIEEMLG